MENNFAATDPQERVALALRELYAGYGYRPYRMSKFEEYDLYSRHKDFLVSDGVITFTDTNGKLMALKPDVTLSIIKNSADRPDLTEKLYYSENVYRVSKRAGTFREIPQTGLECFGDVDGYAVGEVLLLAAKSLAAVGGAFVLDVSHLGLLCSQIDRLTDKETVREELLRCAGEKNVHGVSAVCAREGLSPEKSAPLCELLSLSGPPSDVLPSLSALAKRTGTEAEAAELGAALAAFTESGFEKNVRVDFSVVSDRAYYNGIVFKGFVEGIPECVLSGGQYDNLMRRMGRRSRAIGFAVYPEPLGRIGESRCADADVMLIYEKGSDPAALRRAAEKLIGRGESVLVCPKENPKIRCKKKAVFRDGEVIFLGADA